MTNDMLSCPNPTCQKKLNRLEPQCPHCRADLGLLVDFAQHLDIGLDRAEERVRAGELGEAVWAYLEILEVDPDNPTARRQIGQVVTAVRQFDQADPGRRWLQKLRKHARQRRQVHLWETEPRRGWFWLLFGAALVVAVAALIGGYWLGYREGQASVPAPIVGANS